MHFTKNSLPKFIKYFFSPQKCVWASLEQKANFSVMQLTPTAEIFERWQMISFKFLCTVAQILKRILRDLF
jgi:hypothetical protein